MKQRRWTVGEEQALKALADLGEDQVAAILDRTHSCIRKKASRLHISVKKRTNISVTELSQAVIDRIKKHNASLLCPGCGKRFAGPKGICGVCHKQGLIDDHNERMAELVAGRELNRVKKQEQRLRDKSGIAPDHPELSSRHRTQPEEQ